MNMPWRISERIFDWIRGYVKQGKSLGTVVFWDFIKLKEVKSLIDKYEKLPQYLKNKARFCVCKQEAGKGKVPYQANGKRAKANKVNTFTDFKKALDVVDKFDGLG